MSFKLIISIVPHNKGELITNTATKNGATGGSILMGRGTGSNGFMQLFGFGDSEKDITYNIVPSEISKNITNSIIQVSRNEKKHFGILFTISVGEMIKSGNEKIEKKENEIMEQKDSYQVINIIVNKGYADDAMAAARKAGAGGGTIINARGTAKDDDKKFFGLNIVPEKELLMIITPTEKKEGIVQAIKDLNCFSNAGSGIVFCNDAADFTLLGKID